MTYLTRYQREVAANGRQISVAHRVLVGNARGTVVDDHVAAGGDYGAVLTGDTDILVRRARFDLAFDATLTPRNNDRPTTLSYNNDRVRLLDLTFSGATATSIATPATLVTDDPLALIPRVRARAVAGGAPVVLSVPLANAFTLGSAPALNGAPAWISPTLVGSPLPAFDTTAILDLRLDPSGLPAGSHEGVVSYRSSSGRTFAVGVRLDLATPYGAWRAARFTSAQLADPEVSSDLADPDGDGANNLVEYALDRSALAAEPPASPESNYTLARDAATGRLALTFRRARAELTYVVEACADLAAPAGSPDGWQPLVTNPGAVGQLVTVADTLPVAPGDTPPPRRFLRLRVEAP